MRFIGKSKVGRLSAKKGKIYPQIRLSTQLADAIGEIANVFETERNGKRAFLLVTDKSVQNDDMVLQSSEKVVKPCADIAHLPTETSAKNAPDSIKQLDVKEA